MHITLLFFLVGFSEIFVWYKSAFIFMFIEIQSLIMRFDFSGFFHFKVKAFLIKLVDQEIKCVQHLYLGKRTLKLKDYLAKGLFSYTKLLSTIRRPFS